MTAPTPERPLDVEALRQPQNARHDRDCAFQRWARRTDYTRPPDCDCDWPAILAALTELEGLRAEVARLPLVPVGERDLVGISREGNTMAVATKVHAILRAAREAEEASRG